MVLVSGIYVSCMSDYGRGGLGKHLEFVSRTAKLSSRPVHTFCCHAPQVPGFYAVKMPGWNRLARYTPIRWLPSAQVFWNGVRFDQKVCSLVPGKPVLYHGFPGQAEQAFQKVRRHGGITILEAATTHVSDLYADTSEEHARYNLKGSPFSGRWVDRVLQEYELADYISVASSLQRESFIKHGVSPGKLFYAPLGVDTAAFSPLENQPSARPRKKTEKFRIIQLGQVSLLKGFPYLLEAAASLRDPEIELVLFGGIGWRSIRKFIDDYRDRGVNIKLGAGDPVPELRKSHLCVHSSVSDGFGYAPLEAMSAGLPVVVTDGTGMKDLIRHGMNGYVVPRRDPSALADAIAELKADNFRRIRMGKAAREAAMHYDIGIRTEKYARLLRPVWKTLEVR